MTRTTSSAALLLDVQTRAATADGPVGIAVGNLELDCARAVTITNVVIIETPLRT
ncbi:conserved hypothetical protein [Histoplasma capsulatum var. duboisii H88]|uniref:Uncharacterized protein n=1 Tax=Ajellomyces capsulatus (strain H88) TaxID=544711 RepID=F0UU84_AJEC8|nr:conserved hypothetical protein [Histoplasma capsulatum var. duboisii H88]